MLLKKFLEIQASPELLREHMVRLSNHGYRRARVGGWVTGMRVLIVHECNGVETTSSEAENRFSEVQPHLSSFSPHVLTSNDSILRLACRSALIEPSAYVTVSYCWHKQHSELSAIIGDKPCEVFCENLAWRPSNTPPDALDRSLAYVKAHNINTPWIDQECIDQSDLMDKGNGIQEMDKVYQEFESLIAVLEFNFQSQIELDVFASICHWKLITFDPSHLEVLESVLIALTNERWFERAWTL